MSISRFSCTIGSAVAALSLTALLAGPALAQDIIKVGAPLPLTGPLSPEGLKQKRGYDLWADAANAKGIKAGGKTIRSRSFMPTTPRIPRARCRPLSE